MNLSAYLPGPRADNRYRDVTFSLTAMLLGISLPTSNLLMHAALVLVVVCLLWRRDFQQAGRLIRHPMILLPLAMFLLLAWSLLWRHSAYGPEMVDKYKKLLYVLPLTLFFLHRRVLVKRFLGGFLLANAIILFTSLSAGLFGWPAGHIDPANPTVFKLHITQNFFMALTALVWLSRAFVHRGPKRWGYIVLTGLAAYDILFLVLGRTGYVALAVGAGIWMMVSLTSRQRILVLAGGVAMIGILSLVPNRAAQRIGLGVDEIRYCLSQASGDAYDACSNSMGQRTEFVLDCLGLIRQAPLWGNGAGSFWYGNAATGYHVNNPHNEYLLETVQTGLVGLALFLAWMLLCYRIALRQPIPIRNMAVTVLTVYMVCHLFNSFLLDSAEGHLFVIIAAILTGYALPQKKQHAMGTAR